MILQLSDPKHQTEPVNYRWETLTAPPEEYLYTDSDVLPNLAGRPGWQVLVEWIDEPGPSVPPLYLAYHTDYGYRSPGDYVLIEFDCSINQITQYPLRSLTDYKRAVELSYVLNARDDDSSLNDYWPDVFETLDSGIYEHLLLTKKE